MGLELVGRNVSMFQRKARTNSKYLFKKNFFKVSSLISLGEGQIYYSLIKKLTVILKIEVN